MNDNYTPAFRAATDAVPGLPYLRLVWSAQFCPVGNGLSPWERLEDFLIWSDFIRGLERDIRHES